MSSSHETTAATSSLRSGAPAPTPVAHHRFETLAEALSVAILTANAKGDVDYVNPAARELFWRSDHELLGQGWLVGIADDEREAVRQCAEEVVRTGNGRRADFRLDVAGFTRWVRARFNALPEEEGTNFGWVAIFDDVTADRANSDELARRAAHDPLTGLPNRTLLDDRLSQALARSRRDGTTISVFFLDLDRFKPVNDRLGHQAGDVVLRELGRRIRHTTRADDTAARIGGDEFVIVAEGISQRVTRSVARRLAHCLDAPIQVADTQVQLTMSIGVVWTLAHNHTAASLLHEADLAMYEAKRRGDSVAFAETSDDAP
jgi:diguanylate cyclase (GGDEF)-like protein/PAS domain S-box-containing protein